MALRDLTRRDVLRGLAAGGLLLSLPASLPSRALARDVEGVHFDDTLTVGGQSFVLNGVGVRHATIFRVSVYAAGLYLPAASHDQAHVLAATTPKHLVAVFRRDVGRDQARDAFRDAIRAAAGSGAAAIESDITRFAAWIPAFAEGQRLTATFTPGSGITLTGSAASASFHASEAFGTALFGAWVGSHPVEDDLRRDLLGN